MSQTADEDFVGIIIPSRRADGTYVLEFGGAGSQRRMRVGLYQFAALLEGKLDAYGHACRVEVAVDPVSLTIAVMAQDPRDRERADHMVTAVLEFAMAMPFPAQA